VKRPTLTGAAVRARLGSRVETTLSSFKASVEAHEVAAFDGWENTARLPADAPSSDPSDAALRLDCLDADWTSFKARLLRHGESEVACRCGAHFLSAFLIRDRWSLIVLGRQSLIRPPSELLPVRTTTIATLARILPALDAAAPGPAPGDPQGGDGGAAPAELGIPLWWARAKN
jgi:hypothetical protein